jgi:hypothetical protein
MPGGLLYLEDGAESMHRLRVPMVIKTTSHIGCHRSCKTVTVVKEKV